MLIRPAAAADVKGITAIYNDAVANTTAIWNETIVDEADRAAWLAARQGGGFPVLVAATEDTPAGEVLGYATFGAWRPHDGYRHTVEHSIYVHPRHHRAGIGGLLLARLIEEARAQGRHAMIAAIEAGNGASIALHRRFGFVETGRHNEVGTKFGRWLDLAILQLMLDDGPPQAPCRRDVP
ncbi:phosphinothricin acetyltransferase [Pseudochelatococcus lubricantis]|uniref:Phosphinothricin acetyltransferase n=1 Tax=Pseudochelatococcus lubricantis TaxID=1538102 RepID=A0ABX0UZX8_9HYPH|nr:GNAT family N-acetyltransferase [Pseudochelatococcus lubricantis]NIJ56421.1 phosphinothricin acetyltransferase [Pseudochelatococcus lubricantis]